MSRKYEPGERINSFDELIKQKFVFHRKQLISRGWFSNWQIRYVMQEIEKGNIRYSKKVNAKHIVEVEDVLQVLGDSYGFGSDEYENLKHQIERIQMIHNQSEDNA